MKTRLAANPPLAPRGSCPGRSRLAGLEVLSTRGAFNPPRRERDEASLPAYDLPPDLSAAMGTYPEHGDRTLSLGCFWRANGGAELVQARRCSFGTMFGSECHSDPSSSRSLLRGAFYKYAVVSASAACPISPFPDPWFVVSVTLGKKDNRVALSVDVVKFPETRQIWD